MKILRIVYLIPLLISLQSLGQSPTQPAQGFNVFVEKNLTVFGNQTKGAVAAGKNLTIKGDYTVASEDCGDFTNTGNKIGLLVGNKVNYPLKDKYITDPDCDCGDPTILVNGSFETGATPNTWTQVNASNYPGWSTTSTDNRIEIWKTGFLGAPSQDGNYHAEINATQRSALYQFVCSEPGSVLNWSVWHRGRDGVDVAEVKIGGSVESAATEVIMSSDNTAWVQYSGTYTVPDNQLKTVFVFQAISSKPRNNLSYGNLLDNFQVTKTSAGTCPSGATDDGVLTVGDPNYYVKIGRQKNSTPWYVDPSNAPTPIRITPESDYNATSYIQLTGTASALSANATTNSVYERNLLNFGTAFQSMRASSLTMADCVTNVVLRDASNTIIPNTGLPSEVRVTLQPGLNYLNIDAADLNSVSDFVYSTAPDASNVLIINVDAPGNFNWDVWNQTGAGLAESPYILYNFHNTTRLNIKGSNEINGTVYAPFANVRKKVNKENIKGQVIAKNFNHNGGTIECVKFTPSVTNCGAPPLAAPVADFDINISPQQCMYSNEFVFTNLTNTGGANQHGTPITYLWNFGDGTTSTEMDPTKFYNSPGTYTVSLTATNANGSDTKSESITVLPFTMAVVSESIVSSGNGKVVVEFFLTNAGAFDEYHWNVVGGDFGVHRNQDTVTFEFDSAGTYEVQVVTTKDGCTNFNSVPITITSDQVTGGNGGGIESESLGGIVSKVYVNRKKNSVPTNFVKNELNLYNKTQLQKLQTNKGKGQTMLDMFPTQLYTGDVAHVTSPTDILDFTIADEVLSVDFSMDGKTKGVVLGVKTTDRVYNHTKASCDRLRGAEILTITKVELEGYNFLMQAIKQRNGVVEHAISFAIGKNNNDLSYDVQTNWFVNEYNKFNDMYNFQVWTTNPTDTKKLVRDILNNLRSYIPVAQPEKHMIPLTYVAKVSRERNNMVLKLKSDQSTPAGEIFMEEIYSETANNVKYRYNPIHPKSEQIIKVDIKDAYEYDGLVKVGDDVQDAFYHADGNWGLDFDSRYTKILRYEVSNNFTRTYQDDELPINRNVTLKATSEYDYLTLYKSLLPGNLSADYSEYKYLAFKAKGSGLMELGLIKASVENWKEQYRVMVDLSEEEKIYYVPFDIFSSTATENTINPDDLTTLSFTFLPVEAETKDLDLEISDVKFVKKAGDDGTTVERMITYNNEYLAYPNPSQGQLTTLLFSDTASKATVTLHDITGKLVYKGEVNLQEGRNELDFNFNVSPGIMLLNIATELHDFGTKKVIIK